MITDYTREILQKQGGDPDSLPDNLITTHLKAIVANMGNGGGSGVDVTASVGQTIVVEEVDANGKPTKWKAADFQEKICGEGIVELYNATLTGLAEGEALLEGFAMQAGETYYVTWNGVEYTRVCVGVPDAGGTCYIGNGVLVGLEDTGEPFFIMYGTEDGVNFLAMALSTDGVDEATVVIKGTGYTPIPVEYVSNAFPYYIEVMGDGSEDNPLVCNDTVANVEAIYKSGRPIKVKFGGYKNTMTMIPMGLPYGGYIMDMFIFTDPIVADVTSFSPYGYTFGFFCPGVYASAKTNLLWLSPKEDGTYLVSDVIPGDES